MTEITLNDIAMDMLVAALYADHWQQHHGVHRPQPPTGAGHPPDQVVSTDHLTPTKDVLPEVTPDSADDHDHQDHRAPCARLRT